MIQSRLINITLSFKNKGGVEEAWKRGWEEGLITFFPQKKGGGYLLERGLNYRLYGMQIFTVNTAGVN